MRELIPRTLSSLIAVPAVFAILLLSRRYGADWGVGLLLAGVTLVCAVEYLDLMERSGIPLERVSFLLLTVVLQLAYALLDGEFAPLAFGVAVLWPLLWYLWQEDPLKRSFAAVFGVIYIPYLLHFFLRIYQLEDGTRYAILALILVWSYDIAAFVTGSLWGRHKLAPSLSPGKSWEGVAGGVLATLVAAGLTPLWVPIPRAGVGLGLRIGLSPLVLLIVLGLLVSLAVQLGDLFESRLKRLARVKDAGGFLPGHGGLLDRIDGLLFALPVFYFYLRYVLGSGSG